MLVLVHIDTILGDADWLICRLKSEMTSNPAEDIFGKQLVQFVILNNLFLSNDSEGQKSPVGTQATNYCATVCDRLIYVVSACSELVQTTVSPGPTTDAMFKVS